MNKLLKTLTILTFLVPAFNVNAGFPDDLSDVRFIESPAVRDWNVGADLNLSITGLSVILNHRPNENTIGSGGQWPTINIFNTAVNANAWGIVRQDGEWLAGTWEYIRPGPAGFPRSLNSFRFGHFRPPIFSRDRSFNTGDVYGFFVSGTIRAGLGFNNIRERSKFVVYEVGRGVIFTEGDVPPEAEPEQEGNFAAGPVIELLLESE